jgi:hypothetical protein
MASKCELRKLKAIAREEKMHIKAEFKQKKIELKKIKHEQKAV